MATLVTGATGFLGREIVPRLIARGDRVYALFRKPDKEAKDFPGVLPLRGDITIPKLGLEVIPEDIDEVWHLAALTSFRTRNDDILDLVNTMGTFEMIETFKHVQRFIYISTVYVAGDTKGSFGESDLDKNQKFRNRYESSKFNAERKVRELVPHATVFRPGIIVGRYSDAVASSFSGFYRPVKAIVACHRFAEHHLGLPAREVAESALGIPHLNINIRLHGDPDANLPVVPVDWSAETMLANCYQRGKTFNVIPAEMIRNRDIALGINKGIGVDGFHFGLEHRKKPLDVLYNRMIRDYTPYVTSCPDFQTSVGHTCPPIDTEFISRVVHYWRTHDTEFTGTVQEVVTE